MNDNIDDVYETQGGLWTGDATSSASLNKVRWAKITDVGSSGLYYAWSEYRPCQIVPGVSDSGFQLADGGLSGTTTQDSLFQPNGGTLLVGSIVPVVRGYFDPSRGWVYLTLCCCATDVPTPTNECCDGYPIPETVCITFSGQLDMLGSMTLTWNATARQWQGATQFPCWIEDQPDHRFDVFIQCVTYGPRQYLLGGTLIYLTEFGYYNALTSVLNVETLANCSPFSFTVTDETFFVTPLLFLPDCATFSSPITYSASIYEGTCGSGSGPGSEDPVITACCPLGLPESMFLTLSDSTGDCVCAEGTYELTWNGLDQWQYFGDAPCGALGTFYATLLCSGSNLELTVYGIAGKDTLTSTDCVLPTEFGEFDLTETGWCTGTALATVSE